MADIVERLRGNVIADAHEAGRIVDGALAERLIRERHEAADEIERLSAAIVQVRGFASVMAENNWRDLRLHIERQCDVLNPSVTAHQEQG